MLNNRNVLWLIRHGETAWSLSGAHTGTTDIPLTERGAERAVEIRRYLEGRSFAMVLCSPRLRARRTCEIAGYGAVAQINENLSEWDYGDYEGRSTAEIREERPNWNLWRNGVPNGETLEQVGHRAQKVIDQAVTADGPVALFAHGHILRILASCWLDLPPAGGQLFSLGTGSVSTLGFERDTRVVLTWNRSLED